MRHFIALGATFFMCVVALCSCEKGGEEIAEDQSLKRLIVVNGVNYHATDTYLSMESGLNFRAITTDKELTVNLVMKESELNKEYDLNVGENCGANYLQVLFSNLSMESYSVATMGPNSLNVINEWGASELRELRSANAKISSNEDGTYSVSITAEGDGLSFKLDYNDKIDHID
ncbi:MAG: hypothetical protein K6F48_06120 [Paludibacteraceae bacterium]|nr:hypothetical protein [Paludibacteraceae bacterium]